MSEDQPAVPSNAFNRILVSFTWTFFLLVAFFVAANEVADELGSDLNFKIFAFILIVGLAFVGLAAVVWRMFNAIVNSL